MGKIIALGEVAKEKLQEGIEKVQAAVATTMGPWGRNVLIEKEYGQVHSTKDGVTVAKTITLEDPIENMAATVIKQAAIKTVELAGDGTTTSTVLASSIALQALEETNKAEINVTLVKKGIEDAVKEVVNALREESKDISNQEQIKQIAILSANGDEEVGNLVNMAMEKVGRDGIITVEESRSGETSLEVVEGLQFDRGYKSHYFVTDNNTMTAVLTDPYILLMNSKISIVKDLLELLNKVSRENKPLLIIAEDIDGEALGTLLMNKARGALKVCAVKAPGYGDLRAQYLDDIAVLTGATVISSDRGMSLAHLEKNNFSWLGKARTVTVSKDKTTIADGKGDPNKINERILELKNQFDNEKTPYNIEKLQERIGKMIGGVAIINVGGFNDIEIKEKKDRIDDALQATKAALDEGILMGAGVSLLKTREKILFETTYNTSYTLGKKIVYNACGKPFERILLNANENPTWWLNEVKESNFEKIPNLFNVNEILYDPFLNGIVDPTKVVRCALENGAHAAITILLTECAIHEKPSENKVDNMYEDM